MVGDKTLKKRYKVYDTDCLLSRLLKSYVYIKRVLHRITETGVYRHPKLGINRGYLLFSGKYQIYFIECVENISNFTSA